jgi:SAM-dependent methyltransferase
MPATLDGTSADGARNYLDVRYSERERPYTTYPAELTHYLSTRFLAEQRGKRLLDLGAGRGEFLHGFALEGFDAIGIDRSRPSERRFLEPVIEGDYEKNALPFEDESFQVIFNKSVLEHVFDVSRLLGECRRVLAPGGRFIAMVPDWNAQWEHFYDDWTHVRPFTLTGLKECIQSHGFRLHVAERFRQLPALWQRPYLGPVADALSLLPKPFKKFKFVRFSKEWMLLVVADKA